MAATDVSITVKIDPVDPRVANAFNVWMRRFIDKPNDFSREWEEVEKFLHEEEGGATPTYGQTAAAYLSKILTEV
jgi:hypothetical protein